MKLSFVIPCYRSEKTIEAVCDEIIRTVSLREEAEYEIIAVNDSSPDQVLEVLKRLAEKNHRIKVLDLAKNMGKHAALMAGFRHCTGEYIVCVDDDYQCPVDHLWELLEPLFAGNDVSMAKYGVKKQSRFKNWGSGMNAFMMTHLLGKPREFQFSNFAAMKAFVVEEICGYENPYAYINGLILRTTGSIINVPMEERERMSGFGGYNFIKSLKLWVNGFTAFSVKPLRIATLLGALCALSGFLYGLMIMIRKIVYPEILAGYSSLMVVLLIIGGVIMLILGILGEYVGRIYICVNNSPQYVIRQSVNIGECENEDKA